MKLYRALTISRVETGSEDVALSFKDSGIMICIPYVDLRHRYDVNPKSLEVGKTIFIQGKNGLTDADLWGVDLLQDMKLAA